MIKFQISTESVYMTCDECTTLLCETFTRMALREEIMYFPFQDYHQFFIPQYLVRSLSPSLSSKTIFTCRGQSGLLPCIQALLTACHELGLLRLMYLFCITLSSQDSVSFISLHPTKCSAQCLPIYNRNSIKPCEMGWKENVPYFSQECLSPSPLSFLKFSWWPACVKRPLCSLFQKNQKASKQPQK